MNIYQISFDGESHLVEAPTMADAIKTWQVEMANWGGEDFQEDPESIVLVSDKPVIRWADEAVEKN